MRITKIELSGFRNLKGVSIIPHPGTNLIVGDNAQGKTNLLEGIFMFTGQGSFRGARDSEMIMENAPRAELSLGFIGGGRENIAGIILGERRAVSLNGVKKEALSGLTGSFLAVVFSPGHLSLIREGPVFRRAFLDGAISQLKPRYSAVLNQYNRALSQRGALLRDAACHPALMDTLPVWDSHVAKLGALIVKTRESYIDRLSPKAAAAYSDMTGGRESLSLGYSRSFLQGEDIEQAMLEGLLSSRSADLSQGRTTIGPHRDDLKVEIENRSARNFGSQGQQRSAVLCLKIAEAGLMAEVGGEEPVVLLDDVLSELDAGRRAYLLSGLKSRQVFITSCEDISITGKMKTGAAFRVKSGEISPA